MKRINLSIMKTSIIKEKISRAVKNERSSNGLAKLVIKVAKQNGKIITIEEAKGVSELVISYIETVPALMEEGLNSALKFGIKNEMNQMINELESYWKIEQDLVPDNLGLLGITDDAYASIYLLQTLSDYCKSYYHRPLLSLDFTNANSFIRNILGNPIAADIEQKVQVTIGNIMANQIFNQAYQNLFKSGFTFGNAATSYSSQRQIDEQVRVQLGAMGIF
jgi:hypothetical protein